jgi:hypothetical protein
MNLNIIEQLEAFKSGHKIRSVFIRHECGYGASCWEVTINHEEGWITVYEDGIEGDGLENTIKEALKIFNDELSK